MPGQTVTVRILGDASSFERATDDVTKKSEGIGKKLGGIAAGLGLAGAAAGVAGFAKDSVAAFKESEQASARLNDAFAKFPNLADSNAAAFEKVATARSKVTKFDDDATKAAQASLAQFGLTGDQILKLTPLIQDYASKTGKSLPDAAEAVGKAMLGQGKALKEVGINFKDAGSLGGNFDQVMGGLSKQVGGFAEKEGKTAAGQAEILKNQFGELQETVGSKLLPILTKVASILLDVVTWFQNLNPNVQTAIGVVVGLVAGVLAISKAMQAWTIVQEAFNLVMAANPIVLVVIAIAALVAGIIYAYTHFEGFRNVVDAVFHAVAAAGEWMWNSVLKPVFDAWSGYVAWLWGSVIKPVFGFIIDYVHAVAGVFSWVYGNVIKPAFEAWAGGVHWVADTIGKVFDGVKDTIVGALRTAVDLAKVPINGLIWLVNKVIDGLNAIHISIPDIPGLPGRGKSFGLDLPHIPQLARGGIVTSPTLALVGEAGPEAVVPLGRGGGMGVTVNVTVNGVVATDEARLKGVIKGAVIEGARRGDFGSYLSTNPQGR